MTDTASDTTVLRPEAPAQWMQRGFDVIARRMVRKRFHAVRATPAALELLAELDGHAGPAVVCLNHPSWWDPITMYLVARDRLASRYCTAPIDTAMLEQFGFFRRVGLFGLDPEHPGALDAMRGHFEKMADEHDRPTVLLTAQGRFADVREPARLRPGAAAMAADHDGSRVLCLAVEYVFWEDQKPEVLLHAADVEVDVGAVRGTVTGWHRAITRAFGRAQAELAELAIARDEAAFVHPFAWFAPKQKADVHPVYNLVLRLRGRSGVVEARGRNAEATETPKSDTNP